MSTGQVYQCLFDGSTSGVINLEEPSQQLSSQTAIRLERVLIRRLWRLRRHLVSALAVCLFLSAIPLSSEGGVFPTTFELSSLDGTSGFVLNGIAAGDQAGRTVASAGDINGDGIDDILIGARFADPNGSDSGQTYVV